MIIRRMLWLVPLLLGAWIGIMALVMRFSDAAPAAVVIWPSSTLMAKLPDGTAIITGNAVSVTLKSDQAGFGAALYAAGARLVLPAGLTGCLPYRQARP